MKGQCYALGGDEKSAIEAFTQAQNTENVSLNMAAKTNQTRAGSISKLYQTTTDLERMRDENINEYNKLQIEVIREVGGELVTDFFGKKDKKGKQTKPEKEKFRFKDLFK